MSAAHFAIWIKGRALLDAAITPTEETTPEDSLRVAALAFASHS